MNVIRKLKIKYILLSLLSLLLLLTFIVAGLNMVNYNVVVDEADRTLSVLSNNKGSFPTENYSDWLPPGMSPEVPFESRYFSVFISSSNNVISVETKQIYSLDTKTVIQYADKALKSNSEKGFIERYRYVLENELNGIRITFLDCGRKLSLYYDFASTSIKMALLGYLVISVLVCFFINMFMKPVKESHEKQKRFITDAGHEIKTPLTIIRANVDVLEMDVGENEYLEDIKSQINILTGLTNDLVYLSKIDEQDIVVEMDEFSLSDVSNDIVSSFETLAKSQNKEIERDVQDGLFVRWNKKAISNLISILIENAIKYSPEGDTVYVNIKQQGKKVLIVTKNKSTNDISNDSIKHVFERFYRTDQSRNSETGGHGIGLSMAKAIASIHKGKISASFDNGFFVIRVSIPVF